MAEKLLMMALSPTMEKGTIHRWHYEEGERVSPGDILCDVETDKTTMEYESFNSGLLLKIVVPGGGEAAVGELIAIVGEAGEDIEHLLKPQVIIKEEKKRTEDILGGETEHLKLSHGRFFPGSRVLISPLAGRMAHEKGINPAILKGSGPGGRIVKRDILEYLRLEDVHNEAESGLKKGQQQTLSPKRQVIAARLSKSKSSAPHYYLKVEAVVDRLLEVRVELNSQREQHISVNAFFMKLAAECLKRHPVLNSTFDGEFITRYNSCDIALAVAQEDGLITPVVRNCGNKGIRAIDNELSTLVTRAREGRLTPDEYSNATFTISNLGSYGIDEFTAIINQPALAILAIGKIKKVPLVSEENELEIGSVVKLTLSCDHRVIDGAVGAAFLQGLKEMLENPLKALL